jgi:hypothetical protein
MNSGQVLRAQVPPPGVCFQLRADGRPIWPSAAAIHGFLPELGRFQALPDKAEPKGDGLDAERCAGPDDGCPYEDFYAFTKDKETIDTHTTASNAGECATSKRPRVDPQDLNQSAHGTGVAAYDHISPGALHALTEVRQDSMTAVS